jgi:sugar/nucleoside kinase (ribokinase family)
MICAMGLARLGNPVAFAGRTGLDSWGDYCVSALQDAGIDTTGILRDANLRTGVTASLSTAEDRALVTFAGATTALRADDITDALLKGADHLHVSSYYLQLGLRPGCHALFARARKHGLTTSLDPGFDPAEKWGAELIELLDEVDLFLPNDVELLGITGATTLLDGLQSLTGRRARTIVKRGSQGSATFDGEQLMAGPAYPMDCVESTGAGDSFNAGFIHAWLRDKSLVDCLRWAGASGSLSTRGVGGTSRQANSDDVLALIGTGG